MEIFVSKSTPQTDKGSFVLIGRRNIDLVVTRKAIHKREYLTPNIVIDQLVNKGSRIIVFWICAIDVTIINTNPNSALPFRHRDNIRYLVC